MALIVDKQTLVRANSALLFGFVCGGLMVCALGAAILDIARLFAD